MSNLISKATKAEISVAGVHKRGGEYIAGELEQAAMKDNLVRRAAEEILARGQDRRAWLCFCSGVDHAIAMRDALRELGVTAEELDGGTPKQERDRLISTFRHGHIRCLTSVNVLSIGFNVPHVDLIALLRPTESAGLYIQQVGRGFRKAPKKENALILDFAGNVRKHGPVNMVVAKDKKKGTGQEDKIPCKCCPECEGYVPIGVRECIYCGYAWPEKEQAKHAARPEDVDIISKKSETGWFEVTQIAHSIHRKFAKPPTLCVTYSIGHRAVRQWLCFSHPHGSFARNKAERFWRDAGGKLPIPADTEAAMIRVHELRKPLSIYVTKDESQFLVVKHLDYKMERHAA